jgi:hypothetical protein
MEGDYYNGEQEQPQVKRLGRPPGSGVGQYTKQKVFPKPDLFQGGTGMIQG